MGEPTIYKPSIYKGNGIYKNGADGGGGGEYIDVDGKQVKITQIDNLFWTAENISVLDIPDVVYNGDTSNNPRAFWYRKDIRNKGYGLLWNLSGAKKCLDYLSELKNDGWRIPTKSDFESMMSSLSDDGKKVKSEITWPVGYNGTNESGLNIIAGGRYSGNDNWSSYGSEGYLICSTQQNASTNYAFIVFGNADNYIMQSWYLNQCFNLRLCKDA